MVDHIPLKHLPQNTGWIEVICGSMFSGKTEELIRRLRRAQIARQSVAIVKPAIDTRYAEDRIVSHSGVSLPSVMVSTARDILERTGDAEVIGIDEAQFFDLDLVEVCEQLADMGKRVIVAGLDQDYLARPLNLCRNCLRLRNTSPKHWPFVWCAGIPQTARSVSLPVMNGYW